MAMTRAATATAIIIVRSLNRDRGSHMVGPRQALGLNTSRALASGFGAPT
jgi:hypothetical protein